MDGFEAVNEIAKATGGKITEVGLLPGNSGFAIMSMPLRENHWIYGNTEFKGEYEPPPMVFKMGANERAMLVVGKSDDPNDAGLPLASGITMTKEGFAEEIRKAGRYAVRSATMQGKEMDFDPDALLQNLVVAFLGYWTEDGLSGTDEWANPPKFR